MKLFSSQRFHVSEQLIITHLRGWKNVLSLLNTAEVNALIDCVVLLRFANQSPLKRVSFQKEVAGVTAYQMKVDEPVW